MKGNSGAAYVHSQEYKDSSICTVVGYKRTLVSNLYKKKLFKCALVISLVMDGKKLKLGQ